MDRLMTAWPILILAGLFEVGWAIGLKYTHGYTKLWPSTLTVLAMIVSVWLLGLAYLYRDGEGAARDPVQALAFFELAAQGGLSGASAPRDELSKTLSGAQQLDARKRADALAARK